MVAAVASRAIPAAAGLLFGWWLTTLFTTSAPLHIRVRPSELLVSHVEVPPQPQLSSALAYSSQVSHPPPNDMPPPSPPPPLSPPPLLLPASATSVVHSEDDQSSIRITSFGGVAPSSLPLPADLPALDLPKCLWDKLGDMCSARFHKSGPSMTAEWRDGVVRCMLGTQFIGRFKRNNVELEVQLMRGCTEDTLDEEPPPVGISSLPRDARDRSLRLWSDETTIKGRNKSPLDIDARRAAASRESSNLVGLRRRVAAGNESLSILALGASVTFMFADLCTEADSHLCSTGPHESLNAFDERIRTLAAKRKKAVRAEEADWLLQLVRTLKHGYPNTRLAARSVAYGGMNPKAVAACAADFVAPPPAGHGSTPSGSANLVILDFAIFGGLHPFSEDWHAIESLVRALWPLDVAVILLNMPTWCLGETGRREGYVHGHSRCQRMIFNQTRSRMNIAAAQLPDRFHATLRAVALNYEQTSISVFDALQPLVSDGAVDLLDFTHDGKHPIMYPRGTRRGSVLSRYMADLLAHAIDPALLRDERKGAVWRGGLSKVATAAADRGDSSRRPARTWRVLPRGSPLQRTPQRRGQKTPAALSPGLTSATRGVRCYGWGARATRGSWGSIILSDVGFNITKEELAYDETAGGWRPLAIRRVKPGLTSVDRGDTVSLRIDSTLGEDGGGSGNNAEHSMVQLTYLQSYEQVGVLRIECLDGCTCSPQRVQLLEPSRLATLNTTLWRVSESRSCTLRLTNVSPRQCMSAVRGPCSKIKLVALAVAAAPDSFDSAAAAAAAAKHVESTVGLDFL